VLDPAQEQGYHRIWLLGISLGGMAALGYAARHSARLAGVLTLAPYLGLRSLLADMQASGGPRAWCALNQDSAPAGDATDLARELWAWAAQGPHHLPVYLGYGRADRFADSLRALASLLPPEHSFTSEGGHDWLVWRGLWQQWLARGLLAETKA
jgi:pimeloyl-ACP methyl ester carboxylesterase